MVPGGFSILPQPSQRPFTATAENPQAFAPSGGRPQPGAKGWTGFRLAGTGGNPSSLVWDGGGLLLLLPLTAWLLSRSRRVNAIRTPGLSLPRLPKRFYWQP